MALQAAQAEAAQHSRRGEGLLGELRLEHAAREQTQQRADDLAQQLKDAVGFGDSISSRLCAQQAFVHVFQVHVCHSAEILFQTSFLQTWLNSADAQIC